MLARTTVYSKIFGDHPEHPSSRSVTPLREGNGDQKRQRNATIERALATTLPTIVPEYLEPEAIAAGPCPS
jgi:hypothetical protein